jgi:hypothetical protein
MIKYIRSLLILAVILFTVSITVVHAQSDPPPDDPSPDDPAAPIDGGISLLLAAGAAYGGRKVHQLQRDKKRVPLDQK